MFNEESSRWWFKRPCLSCSVSYTHTCTHVSLHRQLLARGQSTVNIADVNFSYVTRSTLYHRDNVYIVNQLSHCDAKVNQWTESALIQLHYNDVIMTDMASQITRLAIVYSTVYSGADQRKHQSSASLAFVWGIHRRPVNSPHKWPATRKMFPFDDVIMTTFRLFGTEPLTEPNANYCRLAVWEQFQWNLNLKETE